MSATEWAVTLQLRPRTCVTDRGASLAEALAERGADVVNGDGLIALTMTATGADWHAAHDDALDALAAEMGAEDIGELLEVHVRTYEVFEAEALAGLQAERSDRLQAGATSASAPRSASSRSRTSAVASRPEPEPTAAGPEAP